MAEAAPRKAGWAELLALPEGIRAEVLGGELLTEPAPLPGHARAAAALTHRIGGAFDGYGSGEGPGGWWILPEVDVRLGEHDIVRPDVAGWRRTRLPDPWEQRPIDVVPDWVCEVVSPSSARRDLVAKRRLYGASGVAHYWLVDPAARTLEALQREGGRGDRWRWLELGVWSDGDRVRVPPFEAVELQVGTLFPPRPSTEE